MKLPDKEWYTIQEVAAKWGWSEADVLHQIWINRLHPSFEFNEIECKTIVTDDPAQPWITREIECPLEDGTLGNVSYSGIFSLVNYHPGDYLESAIV